MNKTESNLSLS